VHSRRLFSTFSKVLGNSIEISTHLPPKMRIPITDTTSYDVTLKKDQTVKDFESQIKENCGAGTQFKVIGASDQAQAMGDILKRKFAIEVNARRFEVYPQLETMIEREQLQEKTRQIINKAMEGRSIPIARRVVLKQYLEKALKDLYIKEGQAVKKTDINKAFENAL
jgi:hypothetical protein